MWLLYDLIIHLYEDAIRIASLFNPKARLWVKGRKGIWRLIESAVGSHHSSLITHHSSLIWFHCASLGEFEQGRPVIEAFRKEHPDWKVLLTFFSPSGYEIRKNYAGADWVFYLPMDTPFNAKKFVRLVKPSIAVFVKYEFWFRYLDRLFREKVPVYVISGIFRPSQHFFRWYGDWPRKQLRRISHFFVQDSRSKELLESIGIWNVTVSGDTRFDRVADIAGNAKSFPLVERFAAGSRVLLAGSTWPPDESLISGLMQDAAKELRFVIAPHEVVKPRLEAIQSAVGSWQLVPGSKASRGSAMGGKTVFYSELTGETAESARVLIIDGIGYLSSLYQYATIAYIGGGFGVGIHNILEAATFGKPVIFGPNYEKFREAVDLVRLGGAFPVKDASELKQIVNKLLADTMFYDSASLVCAEYVRKNCGATKIILKGLC
jgi:3-deoxy-D-manno-octulosonic-acid transferase